MKKTIYCLEMSSGSAERGPAYGWSRSLEKAIAALNRGRARGVTWGEVVQRSSAPKGMRADQWLPPFEDRKAGFR